MQRDMQRRKALGDRAETEAMQTYTNDFQGLPARAALGKRHEADSPSSPQGELTLQTPGLWIASLLTCEEINFCCLRPSSYGHFILAALGNQHINVKRTKMFF